MGKFPETEPAKPEIPQITAGAAAPKTSVFFPGSELLNSLRFFNLAFFCHTIF